MCLFSEISGEHYWKFDKCHDTGIDQNRECLGSSWGCPGRRHMCSMVDWLHQVGGFQMSSLRPKDQAALPSRSVFTLCVVHRYEPMKHRDILPSPPPTPLPPPPRVIGHFPCWEEGSVLRCWPVSEEVCTFWQLLPHFDRAHAEACCLE